MSCNDSPGFSGYIDTYDYQNSDTIVSASSHEFILSMIGDDQPKDWDILGLKIWNGNNLPDTISTESFNWHDWEPWQDETPIPTGNIITYDWISFEKQITSKSPQIKISAAENKSETARAALLWFGNVYETIGYCGYIIIAQKAMPDMNPFTMKIRYNGKLYSTQASLNLNEELIFENPEFSKIIAQIESLPEVEAFVLENDIVDYFDLSNQKASMAIKKLYQAVHDDTNCTIRTDLPLTRSKDPYRFENIMALGYFAMFDDSGFSDTFTYDNLFNLNDICDEQNMRNIGLNDKVSSLAVSYKGTDPDICSVLTIWEDSYFNNCDNDRTKHRISIVATKNNPRVSWENLKSLKCINSSNSWNDRISSFSFAFGNYDTYFKDY